MADVDADIRELDEYPAPIYTKEGAFGKRHLAAPAVLPEFWNGDVPDFKLECDHSVAVDPGNVEVIDGVPEGLCDHCENGYPIAFLRGEYGPLD